MTYKSEFLNTLNERGYIHQCSDFAGLDAKLMEGPQTAYVGYDATAPSLHVGNLISIMMLKWFQATGHKPITLMGGGTTKVGDPSGKDESRKLLGVDSINQNIESIKQVFAKYISYEGENAGTMVNNDDWLSPFIYLDFLREFGPHFTINRMLTMDSVKLRLDREQPLTFLEFNYMLLQAVDFVELNKRYGTILQMGGSDQWGNIINGVELGRRKANVQLFALTTPLLTTASGAKMGKSADGAVWLKGDMLSPYNYWQYWRNTEDADVGRFLKLYTMMPLDEIKKLEALGGAEINEAKKVLAFEATKLCHGEAAALEAAETARKVFEEGATGGNLPTITISQAELAAGVPLTELLVKVGFAKSNGDARRLIEGNGAYVNDNPVSDFKHKCSMNDVGSNGAIKISSGRKKHALVKPA